MYVCWLGTVPCTKTERRIGKVMDLRRGKKKYPHSPEVFGHGFFFFFFKKKKLSLAKFYLARFLKLTGKIFLIKLMEIFSN
jgi:hypothetical protein